MAVRHVRRFAATAFRAAETLSQIEGSNAYGIQLSKAQGHVNGLVGGIFTFFISPFNLPPIVLRSSILPLAPKHNKIADPLPKLSAIPLSSA